MEGCSDFRYVRSIVLPLSTPIIAVMALFYAVGHWNSFFNAIMYLSRQNLYPLQIFLREILINSQVDIEMLGEDIISAAEKVKMAESIKYCVMVVATLPVLCAYPFLQRYFIKGIMVGAIKG